MMNYYEVVPLKIVHGSQSVLTYESDSSYAIGSIVHVPVGRQDVAGIITAEVPHPNFATKPIIKLLESHALPKPLLQLADWIAPYYMTHPVIVWQAILPKGLGKTRRVRTQKQDHPKRIRTHIILNDGQQMALATISSRPSGTTLLHGITGSGKTQLYIELAKSTIAAGRSVIILVPEIALTSQLIAEFTPHFPDLHVTHSTMTESARHQVWQSLLGATTPQLVIGPRSALFSPVPDLGLIVIDECHETSFKQEQSPRYSALRAAARLAQLAQARLILGSATPNVADYYLAKQTNAAIVRLAKPARPSTITPSVTLVDMTKKLNFTQNNLFSNPMIAAMQTTLESDHQVLLFHNRRGTAPSTLCEQCGWQAMCNRCYVPLTLHADTFSLRCHICNRSERVPTSCPDCGEANIIHKGIGTKLIDEEVKKLFPQARIARFDGDSKADATLEKQYQSLYDGDIDIIIGTQVVAKGLDLPKLRMVGVLQADAGLSMPDYIAAERTFQLLAQVCGRVGRNEHPSQVVVQSYQPNHPSVQYGITSNYDAFYETTLQERKRAYFPPFTHLMKLICIYKTESAAVAHAKQLANTIRESAPKHVDILGPTPAFYERVRDTYRWQIIIKSPIRGDLVKLLDLVPPTHWQYELDPMSLL